MAEDFWYNEKRLPELRPDGTWKKKVSAKSGTNQSYNEVKVKANVLEIVQVDQTNENFCAIFTLDFAYVDPLKGRPFYPEEFVFLQTLRKTYVKTAYLDKDGKVKEEFAQVWGTTRSASRESVLVLKVVLKVKDDQSSDDENPPYVYVRKSDLLSIEPVKWENHMALDWTFMNLVEDKSEKLVESRRVEYFDADGGHVHYKLKFSTTFSDSLDLERLPYDRQLLRIQVVGEVPIYMMRFVPMDSQSAGALVYSKARLNEETPKRNVPVDWTVDRKRLPTLEILVEKDLFQRARFDIHIYLERNPNYYLVNVVFFVGVFTLCTGFAFSPGASTENKKLEVLLTILLTTVAHKIIVTSWLPVKPYQSRLDIFIIFCFVFQLLVMVYCVWMDQIVLTLERLAEPVGLKGIVEEPAQWIYIFLAMIFVCGCSVLFFHNRCRRPFEKFFVQSWEDVYSRKQVWPPGSDVRIYHRTAEPNSELLKRKPDDFWGSDAVPLSEKDSEEDSEGDSEEASCFGRLL